MTRASLCDLSGRVAFITGGSSGLGIAEACILAGMTVALTYRTAEHLLEARDRLDKHDGEWHAVHLDVTDREAVSRTGFMSLSRE